MKFSELNIQTQREFPNNARTEGFGWLVRAGYLNREGEFLPLGKEAIARLQNLSVGDSNFLSEISLPILKNDEATYFALTTGDMEIAFCTSCNYVERLKLAKLKKIPYPAEEILPMEKIHTPDCNTIELLANLLAIPKEKTAKALMYTRLSDNQFIFVVVRGDMQLSDAKLRALIGNIRPATAEEIKGAGAAAGYASPIGLKNAFIVVDDLIPQSQNLVAGANETGYHLKNTNYGRDYSAELIEDLIQAKEGDSCSVCGNPLSTTSAFPLATRSSFGFENILRALAESNHDEKGLTLAKSIAPFDVYLMHIPGKTINTLEKANEIYKLLKDASFSILFDERDERAGVKFNDADLIGCPIRITVGERGLQNNSVEVKKRKGGENENIALENIIAYLHNELSK